MQIEEAVAMLEKQLIVLKEKAEEYKFTNSKASTTLLAQAEALQIVLDLAKSGLAVA